MMTEQETYFRALLACHGADITRWPLDLQLLGQEALRRPHLAALIEEEKHFEQLLHRRDMPADSPDLAHRIIAASLACRQSYGLMENIFDGLAAIRPTAFAAMLALVFAVGFGISSVSPERREPLYTQSSSDDEGAIL